MKQLMAIIFGFGALSAFAQAPNIQNSFQIFMFEQTTRYSEGIELIGHATQASMEMNELSLRKYQNYHNYPKLKNLRQETLNRCYEKKRQIERAAYDMYSEDKIKVDIIVPKIARMLKSISENNHMIARLSAEVGSACHIIITSASESHALAQTKTVLGNKASDCREKLSEHKGPETLLQKIKTGWSLFNWNYCRIDQYDLIEI